VVVITRILVHVNEVRGVLLNVMFVIRVNRIIF